jgi:hypothetical protein
VKLPPVLAQVVEAGLTQASRPVLLMAGPVAQNRTSVIHLYLTDRPTVVTDLEVPDGWPPAVELVAS